MSNTPAFFLDLPPEIRSQIHCLVFKQRLDGWLRQWVYGPFSSKWAQCVHPELHYTEKPKAILQPGNGTNDPYILTTIIPIAQVNRTIRREVIDHLVSSTVDVETRVINFDFSHIMDYLTSATPSRKNDFYVQADGTTQSWLTIEICGPYDHEWRANLHRWTKYVQSLVSGSGEMATRHRIGIDKTSPDTGERVPPDLVVELYFDYEGHTPGAARLESNKIFYAVFARHWVERQQERTSNVFGW